MYKSRMRLTLAFAFTLGIVCSQEISDDLRNKLKQVFTTPKNNDPFAGLGDEVTTASTGSIGAVEKCGEGKTKNVKLCVPYYQCDGRSKTIVQTGVTDGFGIIGVRIKGEECDHPLDVCCKIPEGGLNPDLPQPGEPVQKPTTQKPPEDTGHEAINFCGKRNPNGIDFQYAGKNVNEAEYGEFPWMVAILKQKYEPIVDENLAICGGSLITPTVVLTGAHCVYNLKANDIKIRAGEWDTQTTRERLPYQERNVVNIITHSEFHSKILKNNFALLILDKAVDSAENVGTICLPSQGQKIDSSKCLVSGWGKDVFGKAGKFQVILKKVELPLIQRQDCETALRNTRLGVNFELDNSFICAGGQEGKDVCTGDGGSPLVCPDPLNPNRYVQAGIVSWGIGCGEDKIPGVYADVAKFRSWIDEQLQRLKIDTTPYNL